MVPMAQQPRQTPDEEEPDEIVILVPMPGIEIEGIDPALSPMQKREALARLRDMPGNRRHHFNSGWRVEASEVGATASSQPGPPSEAISV